MSNIPPEYKVTTFDFGFTAVDESALNIQPQEKTPSVSPEQISEPILERIKTLEINVSSVLDILERIENATQLNMDTEEYKLLIEKDVKEKLVKLENMIMPLLVNLMNNPEKDYIKWPNRKPMIEDFVSKLLAITRS